MVADRGMRVLIGARIKGSESRLVGNVIRIQCTSIYITYITIKNAQTSKRPTLILFITLLFVFQAFIRLHHFLVVIVFSI